MINSEGILRLDTKLCMPVVGELRKRVWKKPISVYNIHPGSNKCIII